MKGQSKKDNQTRDNPERTGNIETKTQHNMWIKLIPVINKRQRIPKGQSSKDNPERLPT